MAQRFLMRLQNDFSNIDEVYKELLSEYNPDNHNTTEVMFIDSVNFENITPEAEKLSSRLSEYLAIKRYNVKWEFTDYYNHYLVHKRFGFVHLKTFGNGEYTEFVKNIDSQYRQYEFIYERLDTIDRIEFESDYLDQLDKIKAFQTYTKFKVIIENQMEMIKVFKSLDEQKAEHANRPVDPNNIWDRRNYKNHYNPHTLEIITPLKNERGLNQYYYATILTAVENSNNKTLFENENLKIFYKNLKIYNRKLSLISKSIVRMFIGISQVEKGQIAGSNQFNYELDELLRTLEALKRYPIYLNKIANNDLVSLIRGLEFCETHFSHLTFLLAHDFNIQIKSTPLKNIFLEIETALASAKDQVFKLSELSRTIEQPQQEKPPEKIDNDNDTNEKYLHNHIFKDDAFEVWKRFLEHRDIDATKRTDFRFLYEIMKSEKFIHQTVTVKNITDWINETYEYAIEKLQYTAINDNSNKQRMSDYNLIKAQGMSRTQKGT